jgi:hypothetical protein
MKIYVNGVLENTYNAPDLMLAVSNYPLYIGSSYYDKLLGSFFDGIIDEVQLSNKARSTSWIKTEFNNENSPSTFYSVGAEQAWPVYYGSAYIESSIFDATGVADWENVYWSASTPSFGGLDNYTYVSSCVAVKGTVENFENQKDNNSNSWSTLAESSAGVWEARAAYPGNITTSPMGTAACYAENAGVKYVYAFEGKGAPDNVYRYNIAANTWTNMYNMNVTAASGISVVWNRADKIYWLSGGNAGTFYAYNISSNTISAALATPATSAQPLTRYSNSGTTLAYDGGNNIYALLVNSSTPQSWIYVYSISGNAWTFVANTPETIGTGGGLIRLGNYLYVASSLYAVSCGHFLRYDLVNSKWDNLADLPGSVVAPGPSPYLHWDSGDGLENVGTNYIYANVGGSGQTAFFRFNISENKWYSLENTPGSQSNAGHRLAFDGTYLYLVRAFTDNSFWRCLVTGAGYKMEIRENISSIPSADTQTLQMRYKLANTNDNFKVQVWNGTAWNDRGDVLSSTGWTDWSYVLLSSEVIGGTVQVKFVDVNASSTAQDSMLKDYLRVRSYSAPWSTSVVMKLRTGSDNNPYDGAENWSGWYTHDNNTENTSMPNNRYVQYRVELSTTNQNYTPVLLSGSVVIDYTPSGFTFGLWAGWNMISFPVMPDNKNPHSIFPGDYTMFKWNAVIKQYVLCTDDNVENGVGYWFYVSAAENVVVSGTPVNSLTLPLSAGWNLVGSPLGGASIASPDDTPDGSVLPYAFTWDAENRKYTPPITDLVAGAGYWVYALNSCVLRLPGGG